MQALREVREKKAIFTIGVNNYYPTKRVSPKEARVLWLLSTGKTGTGTISDILSLSSEVMAVHEMRPRLWEIEQESFLQTDESTKWLDKIIWMVRNDAISMANENGMIFAEINHRLSGLCWNVKRLMPRTKFLYVWRECEDYIRSAREWGVYSDHDYSNEGRFEAPGNSVDEKLAEQWFFKNSQYIDFCKNLYPDEFYILPFKAFVEKDIKVFKALFDWLGVRAPMPLLVKQILNGPRRNKSGATGSDLVEDLPINVKPVYDGIRELGGMCEL